MTSDRIPSKDMEIVSFELGLAMTNAYLVGDPATRTAVAIDPAWDGARIHQAALEKGWRVTSIWLTHAHFDHFGGVAELVSLCEVAPPVALHPLDEPLWRANGGATLFGVPGFDPGPEPSIDLAHGMKMQLGDHTFEVRHTPGHSPGHVILVAAEDGLVFSGDLIFMGSVGRTDLPGGDWPTLLKSIHEEILVLPDETILLTGHGPQTTVGRERSTNPFIVGSL